MCVGAILGVTVLSNVDGDTLRPILAALLVVIGMRILWRFSRPMTGPAGDVEDFEHDPDRMPPFDDRGVEVVAGLGGVTNGLIGAWGPVVTPFLMHRELPPRFAVGSVNTAEVAVATASATSLLASLGGAGLDVGVVLAMLGGGVLAAPVAAWFVRHVAPRPMGVAVAALLLLTNARELSTWAGLGPGRWVLYAAIAVLVTLAALRPRLAGRAANPPVPVDRAT